MNRRLSLIAVLITTAFLTCAPLTTAQPQGGSAGPGIPSDEFVTAVIGTYTLILTFNPQVLTIAAGSPGAATLTVYNVGSSTFKVTGCKTYNFLAKSKASHKGTCHISVFSVDAGTSVQVSWTWTVAAGTTIGNEAVATIITGTVNGKSVSSYVGYTIINVT